MMKKLSFEKLVLRPIDTKNRSAPHGKRSFQDQNRVLKAAKPHQNRTRLKKKKKLQRLAGHSVTKVMKKKKNPIPFGGKWTKISR